MLELESTGIPMTARICHAGSAADTPQTQPISTMPPMNARLSNFQIRDVVAYLQTLK